MVFDFYQTKTYKEIAEQSGVNKECTYEQVWDDFITKVEYNSSDVVGVFDGDMVAYQISAVSDVRSIDVTKGGKTKRFNTRTEFKDYCKNRGLDYSTFEINDVIESEDVSYCLGTLKQYLKNVKERLGLTKTIIIIGGSHNQRCDILLKKKYKDNRKGMIKPTHLQAVREYLVKYCGACIVTKHETDDLVLALTCEILNNTQAKVIAISIDKDARQALRAFSYYNPHKDEIYHLTGGLGNLEYDKKLSGFGLKWLVAQVFLFDRSDNYAMNSYYIKQFGEKSFYDTFKDYDNEHDFLQAVVDKWKELLPQEVEYIAWNGEQQKDNWLSLAEKHFQLAYMKTSPNDNLNVKKILDYYKVKYEK